MYRYSPPKSNMWGHSLRKMEPMRQKMLFDAFLKKAVAEYKYSSHGGGLKEIIIEPNKSLQATRDGAFFPRQVGISAGWSRVPESGR